MKTTAAFTVYDASAGSGKTFTLVKNYLTIILNDRNKNKFKQILAVTFTNKAVAEMKGRILESLHGFSTVPTPKAHESMFLAIQNDLNIQAQELQQRAKNILHFLLHNYASFSVQTIDKFTQSVIRAFAFDLGLATNFVVELDEQRILEKAVDNLLLEVGVDEQLSKIVVAYAKSKIDEDKSWNIKNSLLEIAKIIFRENDIAYVEDLSRHSLKEFEVLKKELFQKKKNNETKIKDEATKMLLLFEDKGVQLSFTRNSIPKHFEKLKNDLTDTYTAAWKQTIETTDFYAKKTPANEKQIIDEIRPQIELVFKQLQFLVTENLVLDAVLKNITQMSLIKSINDKVQKIKKEEQLLLISDFNKLIFSQVKNQPTPFIYERIGERYKHFFIDEFQDTSVMQWQNLFPLSDNAVSALLENEEQTGTVTIVGDAKQAIYRWRGGKAEQFISLSTQESPFSNPEKEQIQLTTNYRSYSNIIHFNNAFFTHLSSQFSNSVYANLYKKGNEQQINSKEGGYVEFNFIEAKNKEEKNEFYAEKVLEKITFALEKGYAYKDITILVRKNAEGVVIADYLSQHNVPVLSFESLLVKNCAEVSLVASFLEFVQFQDDQKKKLDFLKNAFHFLEVKDYHAFLLQNLESSFEKMQDYFSQKGKIIDAQVFSKLSFYEALEVVVRNLGLNGASNANLQFFMDYAFEFSQNENSGLTEFLEHWNEAKAKLSVIIPEGENAVQIMSIHKSKGLEFPVVIYPFADTEIYNSKLDKVWFPLNNFNEHINNVYVNFSKSTFENYSETSKKIVEQLFEEKELDSFNVLYVALTRASEQLYIISNKKEKRDGSLPEGSFQSFFLSFLTSANLFSAESDAFYCFGNPEKKEQTKKVEKTTVDSLQYGSFNKLNAGIHTVYVNTMEDYKKSSIAYGLFVHEVMAKIKTKKDISLAVKSTLKTLNFGVNVEEEVKAVIDLVTSHYNLQDCFKGDNTIYCEREFLLNNEILRPDRVEITPENKVYIIDYKTGEKLKEHEVQLHKYAQIFEKLGYSNVVKSLIYVNKPIKIVSI